MAFSESFVAFLDLFSSGDSSPEDRRRAALLVGLSAIGIAFLTLFGITAFIQDKSALGYFDLITGLALAVNLLDAIHRKKIEFNVAIGLCFVSLLYVFLYITGGVNNTAGFWYFTYPLIACYLLGSLRGSIAFLLMLVPVVLMLWVRPQHPFFTEYSINFVWRFAAAYLVVGFFSYLFERSREISRKELDTIHQTLENKVADRTAELVALNIKLKEDIEKRKIVEKAVEMSEKRYRTLFEKAGDGIFILDTSKEQTGQIIDANPSAAKMHGYTRDEIIGRNIRDLDAPEDAQKAVSRIEDILLKGKWLQTEMEHVRKNGSVFPVEVNAGLLDLGQYKYVLAIDRDITERRGFERKLRRSEKMEAMGTLAGGVAHDLNNVLSGIINYPELILLDLPKESELRPLVEAIQISGEKAGAMVRDLLTLARRGVSLEEIVDVSDAVTGYLASPEFKKMKSFHPHVRFETALNKQTVSILGSSVHISKTIMNLVTNAAEAIAGDGCVTISTENVFVNKDSTPLVPLPSGRYALLSVSDTGVGISPEDIQRIFEPFYTKKKMGRSGTGLGMAVVWLAVQDHYGHIDVNSKPGQTTFRVYLPETTKAAVTDPTDRSVTEWLGHGETILIVDDMAEQRDLAARMLKRLNYRPASVSSGEKAVAYVKNQPIDLLLLDIMMAPGMNGFDTYRTLVRNHPDLKAIFTSGMLDASHRKKAEQLGGHPYLAKPYKMEELGAAIKASLAASSVRS